MGDRRILPQRQSTKEESLTISKQCRDPATGKFLPRPDIHDPVKMMKSAWFATQADMIETMHKALNDNLKPADLELEKHVGPKVKRQLAAARSILDQRNDMIQQQKRARIAMAQELAQVDILERRIEKLELENGQQDRALGVACQAFDTVTGQYEMLQGLAKTAVETWPTCASGARRRAREGECDLPSDQEEAIPRHPSLQ